MTKLVYTIWALILNCMGISVFKTCFSDAMEDDYGDYLLSGPPITSIIFALGVYTITSNLNFYPASFRKPIASLMGLYEFLVTAFILDFSVACVWTPIDVHIYTTFTRALCKVFISFGFRDAATWLLHNKSPMAILCCVTAIGFFLTTLHVTRSVDFTIYSDFGPRFFADHLKSTMVKKIASELPKLEEAQCDGSYRTRRSRGRKRSRKTTNSKSLY
ncbi:uncharacterized protein LOC103316647 isoform X1 [Nasonia vitripennis]|uniref:Uncharacterized protein n=2 Tax=Nasonia vitripennis TaxID=7425 RepID=A0A7M7QSX9_NASVI|nr:uncharacterized protein LOC103316647 isoform X1 [Nasonia vitripennis]